MMGFSMKGTLYTKGKKRTGDGNVLTMIIKLFINIEGNTEKYSHQNAMERMVDENKRKYHTQYHKF